MSAFRIVVLIAVIMATLGDVKNVLAYRTIPGLKLPSSGVNISISTGMDTPLLISGSFSLASNAVNQWYYASIYSPIPTSASSPYSISTVDFLSGSSLCGNLTSIVMDPAVTCFPSTSNGQILQARILLNAAYTIKWNTSGISQEWFYDPVTTLYLRKVDFLTVVLHEVGHMMGLDHPQNTTTAVMWPNYVTKQKLTTDDTNGVTQIYGPWTSWDDYGWATQAMGNENYIAYSYNVNGYNNSWNPPPELGPRNAQNGIATYGGKYLMLAGRSTANYSYAYMRLFTNLYRDETPLSSSVNYRKITSGSRLSWHQYSYQQTRMSLDLAFTDGTNLRDYLIGDQNGVPTHPTYRWVYGPGQWNYFTINLTPLAGKTIKDVLVAYDNGGYGNGASGAEIGQYKAFFENLLISIP